MSAIKKAERGEKLPSSREASTNSRLPPYTTVPIRGGSQMGRPNDCT